MCSFFENAEKEEFWQVGDFFVNLSTFHNLNKKENKFQNVKCKMSIKPPKQGGRNIWGRGDWSLLHQILNDKIKSITIKGGRLCTPHNLVPSKIFYIPVPSQRLGKNLYKVKSKFML